MGSISRFVFNFRSRCNMRCPYCYIPFVDPHPGDLTLWKSIVDKLATFEPDIITFGGGDPFAHADFVQLLRHSRQYPFQIHVDTNTIRMPLEQMGQLRELVDVMGVPLDGSSAQHNALRNYPGHYERVCSALDAMAEAGITAKVNTVSFPEQEDQLVNIARKLGAYPNIRQWFIYEYWHFKGINREQTGNAPDVQQLIPTLRQLSHVEDIHYSTVTERSPAYIFVSSLGNLYTVGEDNHTYVELANIFDAAADEILASLRNTQQISARARLKRLDWN